MPDNLWLCDGTGMPHGGHLGLLYSFRNRGFDMHFDVSFGHYFNIRFAEENGFYNDSIKVNWVSFMKEFSGGFAAPKVFPLHNPIGL